MKRISIWAAVVVIAFSFAGFSDAFGQTFDEGEEYAEPTELSLKALQEPYVQILEAANTSQSEHTITVLPNSSEFPDITLTVSIQDADGFFIGGLTADDVSLFEQSTTESDAVAQELTCFHETVVKESGISFAIAVDVSYSMNGARAEEAKDAARDFIANSLEDDRASLISFSGWGTETIELPVNEVNTDSDANGTWDILDAVDGLNIAGMTALFDGTALAIDSLAEEPGPKAVIVFSDGITNNDFIYDINSLIEKANTAGVMIFSVVLDDTSTKMENIAQLTGGMYYYTPSSLDMAEIYDVIAAKIRSEFTYTLCYTTHNPAMDGTTRTVTVQYGPDSGMGFYTVNFTPVITRDETTRQLGDQAQTPGATLTISGEITDADAAEDPDQALSAELAYRQIGTEAYSILPLVLNEGVNGVYSFSIEIPAENVLEPGIEYYLHASDLIRETFAPVTYDTQPYTISVGADEECLDGNCDPGGGCFISESLPRGYDRVPGAGTAFAFLCSVVAGAAFIYGRRKRPARAMGCRFRPTLFTLMVAVVVLLAVSPNVQADEEDGPFIRPGAFTLSPMVGGYVFDSSQDIEEGPVFGLGLGYNFTENWAVRFYGHFGEFDHPYWDVDTCGCVEEKVDASVLQADLVYHLWPGSRFVPYLAAGAGYTDLDFANTGEDSSTTLNYGGGVKYFLTRNLALKANVRHIYWLDDSESNMMANVGLEFQFGGSKQEPATAPAVEEPAPTPAPAPAPVPVEKPAKPEPKVVPPVVKPVPETLVLRINFKFDDATVEQAYHDEIENAVQFLNRHPGVDATIEGHTCSMGPESYNMGLSRKRAESVKAYMIRNFDVDGTRLSTEGYGESRPEHDNATLEGKRLNRRVVIRLEEE